MTNPSNTMEAPLKLSFTALSEKQKQERERLFEILVSSMAGWTHFTEEILTKSFMHYMGAFSEKRKTPNIDMCNLQDKIPAVKLTALSGLCWSGLHERQPVWNMATNGSNSFQHQLFQLSCLYQYSSFQLLAQGEYSHNTCVSIHDVCERNGRLSLQT